MKCLHNGIWDNPLFYYSIIPPFHFSIFFSQFHHSVLPVFFFSIIFLFHHSIVPLFQPSLFLSFHFPIISFFHHSNIPAFLHISRSIIPYSLILYKRAL